MRAKFGLLNDTNNPVLAQGFGYEYDPIGNRTSSKSGGTTSTSSAYSANNLNQYTERAVSGKFSVLGSATEDAYVTVSLTNGTPSPADRQGKYWHKALEVDNTVNAAYPEIKVTGVYNPQSAGMPDVVSEEVGRKFIAKTPEQFTYDADGNMTSDGRYTYTWDAENRLIAVESKGGAGVPPASLAKAVFAYDYMGRRVSKQIYRRQGQDWASAPQKEIAYIYDGWNLICESVRETKSAGGGGGPPPGKGKGQGGSGGGGGGSVSISTNYYVWGLDLSGSLQGAGGIGGLLMMLPSSGGVGGGSSTPNSLQPSAYYPLFDANGNITEYISTNGTIAAHYEYSPFGETIVATGSRKDDFQFRFSTKYLDVETALYNYGYRYYSPTLGRWLSRDPIEESDRHNLYIFSRNLPISILDLFGLIGVDSVEFNVDKTTKTWSVDKSGAFFYVKATVNGKCLKLYESRGTYDATTDLTKRDPNTGVMSSLPKNEVDSIFAGQASIITPNGTDIELFAWTQLTDETKAEFYFQYNLPAPTFTSGGTHYYHTAIDISFDLDVRKTTLSSIVSTYNHSFVFKNYKDFSTMPSDSDAGFSSVVNIGNL